MKILVTGATGFIGKARVKYLLEQGHDVIGVGNTHQQIVAPTQHWTDLSDKDSLDYIASRYHPERIEHFASQATVGVSRSNPWITYKHNVLGAVSVFETALKHKIPILAFTTDKYYGDREVSSEDDRPIVCAGAYETSKLCQDLIAQSYKIQGLDVVIARSCNVFGPNDYNRRIVPNVLRTLKEGRRPAIFSNIVGIRQYIYIFDLMRALDCAFDNHVKEPSSYIYNIGTDIKMTQEDTVKQIIDVWNRKNKLDKPIVPEYLEGPNLHEIPSQYLVWTKMHQIGWHPRYNFEDAISEIIDVEDGKPELIPSLVANRN